MTVSSAPAVSIVIPCYNEEKSILPLLERVLALDVGEEGFEVIVVDDGSTDRSRELLSTVKDPRVRVIHKAENGGKGSALQVGFQATRGRAVIVQDADLEYFPEDIPNIVRAILEGKAQAVYGSRFRGKPKGMTWSRTFANKFLTWFLNIVYGCRITDSCTCYKAFSRSLASQFQLVTPGFVVCHEMTAGTVRRGHRILEVPIRYEARHNDVKSSWRELYRSIVAILKFRFSPLSRAEATRVVDEHAANPIEGRARSLLSPSKDEGEVPQRSAP